MKKRPNPATDHKQSRQRGAQTTSRSSALVRDQCTQFIANPCRWPQRPCPKRGYISAIFPPLLSCPDIRICSQASSRYSSQAPSLSYYPLTQTHAASSILPGSPRVDELDLQSVMSLSPMQYELTLQIFHIKEVVLKKYPALHLQSDFWLDPAADVEKIGHNSSECWFSQ